MDNILIVIVFSCFAAYWIIKTYAFFMPFGAIWCYFILLVKKRKAGIHEFGCSIWIILLFNYRVCRGLSNVTLLIKMNA